MKVLTRSLFSVCLMVIAFMSTTLQAGTIPVPEYSVDSISMALAQSGEMKTTVTQRGYLPDISATATHESIELMVLSKNDGVGRQPARAKALATLLNVNGESQVSYKRLGRLVLFRPT
jgi:hypothetical protein